MSKLKTGLLTAMALSLTVIVGCSKSGGSGNSSAPTATDTVFYSNWIPLHLVPTGTPADSDYEQKISASALTASRLNKALVTIFVNHTGSGGNYQSYVSDVGIYPTFSPGLIYLDAYGTYGYIISFNNVFDSIRYIIVPGTVSTTRVSGSLQTYSADELRQMDYATLTKILNIPPHGSFLK
jgi:hypothetical protein